MYLKIKIAQLVPDKFGNKIEITRIGLYDQDGKWLKWVKLNEFLLEQLLDAKINVTINSEK